MRKPALLWLLMVAVLSVISAQAFAGSVWNRATQATVCQTVDDSPAVTVLAADGDRIRWTIWTTSGAATIYFRENGTATAPPEPPTSNTSGPLVGGQSYTEDQAAVTSAVSVITKTGSAYVCVKSLVNP